MMVIAMQREAIQAAHKAALESLRPPANMALSDWIEGTVHLPSDVSSLPGKMRLWPFQREIADAIGDPAIERVTIVKPVRVGFTSMLTACLAHHVANDPAPILALLPTESDCRDYVVSDVEPVFGSSPALNGLLSNGERSTLLSRRFAGGSLKIVAARAPRNLRRHNVRILLCDETDGYETTNEGDPITLAERRTLSFADRKIVLGSTPVHEASSPILRAYKQSDMRVWEVPCPKCGVFSELAWGQIEWPEGEPSKAKWRCPSCEALILERHKSEMVAKGSWRATRPEVSGHAGFRLNALTSLLANASWGKLAVEFLQAKDDPATLQTFVNTILAEGWSNQGQSVSELDLAARAEVFGLQCIPNDVLALTAGVDVQNDRLETTFCGWSETGICYILAHSVIWGPWDDDGSWAELDHLLSSRWTHPLGGSIGIDATVIDAGSGLHMAKVQAFCQGRSGRKLLAGKGVAGFSRPWVAPSKGRNKLWIVGVDVIKQAILDRLQRPGLIRFSSDLGGEFYEQLTSEHLVVRYSRGQPTRRWERIPGRVAEALDATVYAHAARQVISPSWEGRRAKLARDLPEKRPAPKIIRSQWLKR
ncbi:MAG: phage terminase large subunit family protein [Pseudomonadota bacterium]